MKTVNVLYPDHAAELAQMLDADQTEKKALARAYFKTKDQNTYDFKMTEQTKHARERADRMLQIVEEIGELSLSNLGAEASVAISVLAVHSSLATMKKILALFTAQYARDKDDTYYQAIPMLTDWILVLERQPQQFGTQWLWDNDKKPFLPPVDNFADVNERRKKYGIGPVHWPKSLAIPEEEQPWLQWPLSDIVMRDPTEEEYQAFAQDFIR